MRRPLPPRRPAVIPLASLLGLLSLRACSPALPGEIQVATPTRADAGGVDASEDDASEDDATFDGDEPGPIAATDAGSDAAVDASAPGLEGVVEIEKAYLTWARPRPKGKVAAGAHDELVARWNLGGTSDPAFPSNRPGFHPGTRVKVDTRVIGGRLPKSAPIDRRTGKHAVVLSETSLLVRSRKHGYWPYRLCFERESQTTGKTKGGATLLRFSVDRTGRIAGARVVQTNLEAADVVDCLREQTLRLPLLPPPRRIEVELSVQVWPGDALLPSLGPAPSDPALALPLDSSAISAALEQERDAFADCHAAGLARDPGLWGRLQVRLRIDAKGAVQRAQEAESRFPDGKVSSCVLGRLKAIRFPIRPGHASEFDVALRLGRVPERSPDATP